MATAYSEPTAFSTFMIVWLPVGARAGAGRSWRTPGRCRCVLRGGAPAQSARRQSGRRSVLAAEGRAVIFSWSCCSRSPRPGHLGPVGMQLRPSHGDHLLTQSVSTHTLHTRVPATKYHHNTNPCSQQAAEGRVADSGKEAEALELNLQHNLLENPEQPEAMATAG